MGSTLGRGRATGKVRFHGAIVVRFGAQDSPHADRARKAPFRGPLEVQWLTCRAAPGMKNGRIGRGTYDQRRTMITAHNGGYARARAVLGVTQTAPASLPA